MTYKRVSVDTSKAVFTVHAIDASDRPVHRQDYTRARFVQWIASRLMGIPGVGPIAAMTPVTIAG